jgi:hypothetical protein
MRRALAFALLLAALPCAAQESRPFKPIPRPGSAAPSTEPAAPPAPAALRAAVDRAVASLERAWNTPDLEKLLSSAFYDRQRLLDAMVTKVPRDARLRIVGVQAIQVLGTVKRQGRDGREEIVTRVSVTLRTQVEYNDPASGFQRLEGLNEAVFAFPGTF